MGIVVVCFCIGDVLNTCFLQVFGHHICVILTKYHKLCIFFGYHGSLILPRRRLKYLHVFSNIFGNQSIAILTKNINHLYFLGIMVILSCLRLKYMFFQYFQASYYGDFKITPHYRSEGRRQGPCAVFGRCLTLSADLAKSNAF